MFTLGFKSNHTKRKFKVNKYYKCNRCGYVTTVKDSYCPICAKDGYKIKLK